MEDVCNSDIIVSVVALIGGPNSLVGQGRERGGNLAPYEDIWGPKSERLSFHFSIGGAEYLVLVLHLTPFLDTGAYHRQARGTHVNVRKIFMPWDL